MILDDLIVFLCGLVGVNSFNAEVDVFRLGEAKGDAQPLGVTTDRRTAMPLLQ